MTPTEEAAPAAAQGIPRTIRCFAARSADAGWIYCKVPSSGPSSFLACGIQGVVPCVWLEVPAESGPPGTFASVRYFVLLRTGATVPPNGVYSGTAVRLGVDEPGVLHFYEISGPPDDEGHS